MVWLYYFIARPEYLKVTYLCSTGGVIMYVDIEFIELLVYYITYIYYYIYIFINIYESSRVYTSLCRLIIDHSFVFMNDPFNNQVEFNQAEPENVHE